MTKNQEACTRPKVNVYTVSTKDNEVKRSVSTQLALPDVFKSPIRNDLVSFVHDQMSKNRRQPYAVSPLAGVQCSAESWGTGRAVARIPRVRGSGSHRTGQAAYGNMCRGGHMFNPTTTWRKWYRRINRQQKRLAVVSGIAASSLPSLVFARGHKINKVPELPLVVDNKGMNKTKDCLKILIGLGLGDDLQRCKDSKKIRIGKGKSRNRRYVTRKGPLIVHNEPKTSDLVRSLRNVPGVDLLNVNRLNLLKLCPGGHLGRLIVWTKDAFQQLSTIYPDQHAVSECKKRFLLPYSKMDMPDISAIINSVAVQKVLRPKVSKPVTAPKKRNPLKNKKIMEKLNPLVSLKKTIKT